ncbi:hypothetical protein DPMN_113653 [Dreissena polymorpha]|uniref:Uncharacterized protein n=1 Tax=Dreissena polymorpha TaxID=45954 RepID=A0A9D4QR74_DREPO|nr:hypothetical protein DPMN_113653 [Dreissena polymorpha]
MSVKSGYDSNGNSERAETSGSQTEKRAEELRGRMLVKMDFTDRNNGKRNAAMQRWKRDRSEAHSRIRILEQERKKTEDKTKIYTKGFTETSTGEKSKLTTCRVITQQTNRARNE